MEPPAYSESTAVSAPGSAPARRSIQDTRALILGNANILRPRKTNEPIELIVAKQKAPQASAEETAQESHYVFVVTRPAASREVEILLKSKPRDTIEEALEEMLEQTEVLMAEILLRHGKHVEHTGCCILCTRMMVARTGRVL